MCACAIDIGTCNIVSARQDSNGGIQIKSVRDAFLDVDNDPSIRSMLSLSKINFIESEEKLYLIGDASVTIANIFKRNVRRPMSKGILSPGEAESERIMLLLMESVLGKAQIKDEICYYSVPSNPVDKTLDIVYHRAMLSKLLSQLNYKPLSMVEGAAIIYSNCAKEQFSGIGCSFGSGMTNIALLYQTVIGMTFSVVNSGDWIDESVARATGNTKGKIQFLKEKGINLMDPNEGDPKNTREREALVIYYKSLILKVLESIKAEFEKHKGGISLPNSIPIILSGGSSLPKGFKELFEAGFNTIKHKLDIPVSEIRMATSPLNSVAEGLLVAALNYNEGTHK